MLMSSGESLCIIEATNSVVLILFWGVAVLAETRLIIFFLPLSITALNGLSHYNGRATARNDAHEHN